MKPLKKTVSITLDELVLEQARQQARHQDRSLSSYINLVLRKYLHKQGKTGTA